MLKKLPQQKSLNSHKTEHLLNASLRVAFEIKT